MQERLHNRLVADQNSITQIVCDNNHLIRWHDDKGRRWQVCYLLAFHRESRRRFRQFTVSGTSRGTNALVHSRGPDVHHKVQSVYWWKTADLHSDPKIHFWHTIYKISVVLLFTLTTLKTNCKKDERKHIETTLGDPISPTYQEKDLTIPSWILPAGRDLFQWRQSYLKRSSSHPSSHPYPPSIFAHCH